MIGFPLGDTHYHTFCTYVCTLSILNSNKDIYNQEYQQIKYFTTSFG